MLHEIMRDTIEVSYQNNGKIKFDTRTGSIESWKVLYITALIKLAE